MLILDSRKIQGHQNESTNDPPFNVHILCSMGFTACTAYYIPMEVFKEQYAKSDSSHGVKLHVNNNEYFVHSAAPIQTIRCVDKKGNTAELQNGPSIEIRFTNTHDQKTIFYFDTLFLNDSTIIGSQSRYLTSLIKVIPMNNVVKIEIENGHKNFYSSGY